MRIVSLLASATEIVCSLGAGEMLVGRSHECDNPSWVRQLPACSEAAFDISVSSGEIDAEVRRRLRTGEPSVWGRIRDDALLLDCRTLREQELAEAVRSVQKAMT